MDNEKDLKNDKSSVVVPQKPTENVSSKSKNKKPPKMKQLSVVNYCSPDKKYDTSSAVNNEFCRKLKGKAPFKSPQQKRKNRKSSKIGSATNLTKWLSKSTTEPVKESDVKSCDSKENDEINTNTEQRNIQYYDNYRRYGIKMPSYEEIVNFQQKIRAYKQLIDNVKFEELVENQISPVKFEFTQEPVVYLNCKFLTPSQIKEQFYNNLEYAKQIFNGTVYSERHKKFKKENVKDNYTDKDLRYSPSMSVFTVHQKKILLSLLHDEFDHANPFCLNQYYFKVLLPELCLKIFMDVHKMKKRESLKYLEEIPVEDDIDI